MRGQSERMQEAMRTRAVGMGWIGICLLLCFFILSQPTPGRTQEADDELFAEDGLSDEDDPSLADVAEDGVEECVRLAWTT